MRYVMLTFVGPEHAEAWRTATPEDRQAEVDRTIAWFRTNGAHIVGGEELGRPDHARTLRKRGVTDGPFIETKELLGGFIVLDVSDEPAALAIAGGWPGLAWDGDAVEVRPAGDAQAEVTDPA